MTLNKRKSTSVQKNDRKRKVTIGLLVFAQKYTEDVCIIQSMIFLKIIEHIIEV